MPNDLLVLCLTDRPALIPSARARPAGLTTRPVTAADRDALAILYLDSYPAGVAAADPAEARSEIDATFAGEFGELLPAASLIAHLDGSAAGAILTTARSAWDDFDQPFIIDLFVTPGLRRRGIGQVLVEQAVRAARAAGRASVGLRVGAGTSNAARELYRRAGFGTVPEVVTERDPDAVRRILQALPGWFGDPAAIDQYVADAADPRFSSLLVRENRETVGVALVVRHFPESAEVHLIAVAPAAHRRGLGRMLIERAVTDVSGGGGSCLTVHTVGPSFDDDNYAATRLFYRALGFIPLEEHRGLGWWGPTLILVRPLRQHARM